MDEWKRRITYFQPEYTGAANGIPIPEPPHGGPWILVASHMMTHEKPKNMVRPLPMMIFIWERDDE